jgi:predicted  nucleic acid-binding Zn-ribbon protein
VLKKYENSFTKERQKIQALNDELAILKTTKSNYNTEIAALEKEYNDKKQVYLKEIESKYYKEIDNDKKTAELKETIKDLKENIVDLKYNINLFETNPYIMKDKQYYFTDWTLSKMIEYYKSKNDKSEVELQRLEKNREKIQKTIDTIQVRNKVKKIK